MESQENTKTNAKKKKRGHLLPWFLGGGFLSEDFVVKQSKLLILIVLLIVLFISNRYACMKKLTEIENLTRELNDVKYENLDITTRLTTVNRLSRIEDLLKKNAINLSISKTSIYEIEK
jgi:hypothetical protein